MRLSPLLFSALLLPACAGAGDRDTFGRDSDPEQYTDDDDVDPGSDPRDAEIVFTQRSEYQTAGADVIAVASWHEPITSQLRPSLPGDLDACRFGASPPGAFELPEHTLGVGSTYLVAGEGEWELEFDGLHQVRALDADAWEPNQSQLFRVSGGGDLPAQFFDGELGTPAELRILDVDPGDDGVLIEWSGGNDDGHVGLRIEYEAGNGTTWVACRVFDDGLHEFSWSDFDGLPEGGHTLTLHRQTTNDFSFGEGVGLATGESVAKAGIELPGDEED